MVDEFWVDGLMVSLWLEALGCSSGMFPMEPCFVIFLVSQW